VSIIGAEAGEDTLVYHMAPSAKADSDLARGDYAARENDNCEIIRETTPVADNTLTPKAARRRAVASE